MLSRVSDMSLCFRLQWYSFVKSSSHFLFLAQSTHRGISKQSQTTGVSANPNLSFSMLISCWPLRIPLSFGSRCVLPGSYGGPVQSY
ncbi:hypothetical protein AHF37_12742 [Paragonimus kellicotti]|nr:hypothetical protein AHF37_12742 [Paragonimus kellicotti]